MYLIYIMFYTPIKNSCWKQYLIQSPQKVSSEKKWLHCVSSEYKMKAFIILTGWTHFVCVGVFDVC